MLKSYYKKKKNNFTCIFSDEFLLIYNKLSSYIDFFSL